MESNNSTYILKIYESQLKSYSDRSDEISNMLLLIESDMLEKANEACDDTIKDLMMSRKVMLQNRLDQNNVELDKIKCLCDSISNPKYFPFSEEESSIVIYNKSTFSKDISDRLLKTVPEDRKIFFDLFSKAKTDVQRACVVCHYFGE